MKKAIICFALFVLTFIGCSELASKHWQVSQTYKIPVTFGDGTKGERVLIGEEGKFGLSVGSGKEGEAVAQPIVKGKRNKYMWLFWGSDEELNGWLKVLGTNEKGKPHTLIGKEAGNQPYVRINPNNEADSIIPTSMEFPSAGLWKLQVYISDTLLGEIIVNVND